MAHAWVSAGKGCTMKVIRARIAVALAGLAVAAGGFGLTAFTVSSTSAGATIVAASQSASQPSPNTTIYDQ
jgi:hypothetical protein